MKSQQRAQSLTQRRAALLQNSRPPIARYATSKAGAIKGAASLISNRVAWGRGAGPGDKTPPATSRQRPDLPIRWSYLNTQDHCPERSRSTGLSVSIVPRSE
jgi:hypothetical protein